MTFARIGASLYVLWGLLHVQAAYDEFSIGAGLEPGMVQGKIYQGAWDLLFVALFSVLIAVAYNWRNAPLGFWLNLTLVSVADVGFILFVLLPGHVSWFPSILGPVLWISGALFTGVAMRSKVKS